MLIKLKDLYERIFASAGEAVNKSQLQTRAQASVSKAQHRNTNSDRQATVTKDQAR